MVILHSLSHLSRTLRLRAEHDNDAVSSAYKARSTWWDDTGMSLTYRLNKRGKNSPPCATPALMTRLVDVAVWKDASNVLLCR